MPAKDLHVLILEDQQGDAELVTRQLRKVLEHFTVSFAKTRDAFVFALKERQPDIILADYTLPGFGGPESFELAKLHCPGVPFIYVSGTVGEDQAVELVKRGATDYCLKDKLTRLEVAVPRALKEAETLRERVLSGEALERKVHELERSNQLMSGREERMIDLKREVNALLQELGRPPRYDLSMFDNEGRATG